MKKISCLIILVFTLTGCSVENGEKISSDSSIPTQMNQQQSGTDGVLVKINSDNVMAAGYDSIRKVMTVQFKNGSQYEYYEVEPELWASFLIAQPHPWSKVGYPRLVGEGYPYRRIQ
jgi:hypothetical protein